jgi:hypothetical protein
MEKEMQPEDVLLRLTAQLSVMEQEDLRQWLSDRINYLLLNDFNQLVQLLYRVDVDEMKLKNLLRDHPQTDAGVLIADLLIQRQKEKQNTTAPVNPPDDIPEEDKS